MPLMNSLIISWMLGVPLAAQTPPSEAPPPATAPASPEAGEPPTADNAIQAAPETEAPPPAETPPELERDPIRRLLNQLNALRDELYMTRQQLAEAVLRGASAQRELDELSQFLLDHEQFGNDFSKYKAVKEIAEKEARQREANAAKQKHEAERAERDAKLKELRAQRAVRDALSQKTARYRRNGFSPLGLDVYSGKWAFYYSTTDSTQSRIDYQPGVGNYVRLYPGKTIDYGTMTISGSVINGSDQVRNIGVAIAFFDENGNQVGHETVQVNNARPDVPYPFTSKINMALDRAFDSSSTYVLYADPIEDAEAPGAANTSVGATTAPAQKDGDSK